MKCLIIEPDELWRRSMERRMRRSSDTYFFANSRDEAISFLNAEVFDCVVCGEPTVELPTEHLMAWLSKHQPLCVRFLTVSNMTPHLDRLLGYHIHGVLPHPCNQADIHKNYKRVQHVRSICPEACLEVLLCKLDTIPHLSDSAMMCERALARGDALHDIAERIVAKDPGLVVDILRTANLMTLGKAGEVDTVTRALAVIGENTFKNLLITKSMPVHDALFWEQWQTWAVLKTTALLRLAAREHVGKEQEDVLSTIGMLHGIGQPILNMAFTRHYNLDELQKQRDASDGVFVLHAWEQECFGVDHGAVAGFFCEFWGLPEHIVDIIRHHTLIQAYQEDTMPLALAMLHVVDANLNGNVLHAAKLQEYGYTAERIASWQQILAAMIKQMEGG